MPRKHSPILRTPHKDKLIAAINNSKSVKDVALLREALTFYEDWHSKLANLTSSGKQRVLDATILLNKYKDFLEVELIADRGSDFLKRQKGQLKLDNSIMEEFLIHLVHPSILTGLPSFTLDVGPHTAFMTFAFRPSSISALNEKPEIVVKSKDQDFTIGKTLHYKLSPDSNFAASKTAAGEMFLSVLSAEVKVNYDKTMFQECCGTAARLKQGCPSAKYYSDLSQIMRTQKAKGNPPFVWNNLPQTRRVSSSPEPNASVLQAAGLQAAGRAVRPGEGAGPRASADCFLWF